MIVIIGAGVIGLSIAFELAGRGERVTIIDLAEPARAASWAAAGMLAPRSEGLTVDALQPLCEESLALYPEFVRRVIEASSFDPHLRLDGIVHAAYDDAGLDRLREMARTAGSAAILTREEVLRLEPALSKHVLGGLLVGDEGQIDNRRLGRALVAACTNRGVSFQTGLQHVRLEFNSRRVLGVHTDLGYADAAAVINAAGAAAAHIDGVPGECVPPVRPVKGQMLALQTPNGLMTHATWVPGAYFVPRADGRLLIGATVEQAADTRVTAAGIDALLHAALAAAPGLRDFTISESWAGLRPGSPDGMPVLGGTPRGGYFLACGHYRNGILLAPVTARLLASALAGTPVRAAFSLERFGTNARTA